MGSRRAARAGARLPSNRFLSAGLLHALDRALADLAACEAKAAIIGGLAVGARSAPRVTKDVDFAVDVDDDTSAEALVRALLSRGYHLAASLEHKSGRLATVRLTTPVDDDVMIDLLFYFSGIEAEIVRAASDAEVTRGRIARVAQSWDLLATKVIAARDRDLADISLLLERMSPGELRKAEASLRLAERRGIKRQRDLVGELRALIARDRAAGSDLRPASSRRVRRLKRK